MLSPGSQVASKTGARANGFKNGVKKPRLGKLAVKYKLFKATHDTFLTLIASCGGVRKGGKLRVTLENLRRTLHDPKGNCTPLCRY
jgi:hypothetical protein